MIYPTIMNVEPSDFTPNELRMLRYGCQQSTLITARVFAKSVYGYRFMIAPFHKLIAQTLDKVVNLEIKRLIISIPPGFGKTLFAVDFLAARGFLMNPACRFMHSSFSDILVKRNSSDVRKIINSPMFQSMRPIQITTDTNAKDRWATTAGGEFLAVPAKGQATGFRAGQMDKDRFTGAAIFDDMNKPSEALSNRMRDEINFNFVNTFVPSRLAHNDIPVVVIAQRVHEMDLSGFLLRGGNGEKWHHLIIPARIPETPAPYPAKYTHGIPIEYDLKPGPIWPFKLNNDEMDVIAGKNSFVWAGQYMQDPSDIGSQIFPRSYWPRWEWSKGVDRFNSTIQHGDETVRISHLIAYSDTAMKTGTANDYSVVQVWGVGENQKIYLMDMLRGKWEAPELHRQFVAFLDKWKFERGVSNLALRKVCIEDKASGTGLIQTLEEEIRRGRSWLPGITPIPRHIDKVARALVAAPAVERGDVVIPDSAPWVEEFLSELEQFTPNMTHSHDDICDPTFDAIHENIVNRGSLSYRDLVG